MSARTAARLVDWSLLILCNLIWASQFVLAKLVQEQMGPIFATLLPMAIATICLIPLVRRQQARRGRRPSVGRADIVRFAFLGVFGQIAAQLGTTWGGPLWDGLRFKSGEVLTGNVLIMASILGSAFYNVYGKKLLDRYTALEALLYSYCVVLLCLAPLAFFLEPDSLRNMTYFGLQVWLGVVLLAALVYFLSMILFLTVLSRLDATQAGLSNYLIPVFGVVIAAAALGEHLTVRMAIGGLVVLTSTLLVTVYEEHYVPRMHSASAARSAQNR